MSTTATISPQAEAAPATLKAVPAQEPPGRDLYSETIQQLPIQRKLSIGAVDDPLEEEADAMADKVMRMPETPFVQRKCAHCEEEEKVQRRPLAVSITPFIQTKAGEGNTASDSLNNQVNASRNSGDSMDKPTQSFMEDRFGTSFSDVKIHKGNDAIQMSGELNAQAFTVGNDIYFNEGKYEPGIESGKHLLAHELTHTLQQSAAKNGIQRYICTNNPTTAPTAGMAGCSTDATRPAHHDVEIGFADNANAVDSVNAPLLSAIAARWLANTRKDAIRIDGFASCVGDATTNWKLSCNRSTAIETELKHPTDGTPGIPATASFLKFAHGETEEFSSANEADNRKGLVTLQPVPEALPAAVPAAGATDFLIDRVGFSSSSEIFFGRNNDALDLDAVTNIKALKASSPGTVSLIGFTSMEEPAALAKKRADTVSALLTAAPNAVSVSSSTGNPAANSGRSNFIGSRKVEIVLSGATPSTLDCKAIDPNTGLLVNPPKAPCATMDPATETAFNASLLIANEAMTDAINAINPAHAKHNPALITRFFGNSSAATISTLTTNLGNLQSHVSGLPAITQCGRECDKGCEAGPIAYNQGVDAGSTMTVCVPNFKTMHPNDSARNLMHESAHGTSPLGGTATTGTSDLAYRHERLMFQLSDTDRLHNSDSYALFALFAREIRITGSAAALPAGIQVPETDTITGITGSDKSAVEMAIAQLEKRLAWSRDHSSQLFGEARDVKDGKQTWAATWADKYMQKASTLFPVTAPPAAPTMTDMTILAAIIERYTLMDAAVNRDLTINGMGTGLINWPPVPGKRLASNTLEIGPDFFKAEAENQVSLLLEALAHSTPGVEPAFIPAYVSFAKFIHDNATI